MGQLLDLIPWCNQVTKLASTCGVCHLSHVGIFSKRLSADTSQVAIGGADMYIPLCRACWCKEAITAGGGK